MSVLIKNMEMPKNCMDCPFKGFDRMGGRGNICIINESITLHAVLDGLDVKFVRMGDCPLIEVLPHGRLIDADTLTVEHGWLDNFDNTHTHIQFVYANEIYSTPTIIESEKEVKDG